jgi:zinc protease
MKATSFCLLTLILCLPVLLEAQPSGPSSGKFAPGMALKADPEVSLGRLANGLRYYIRKNQKPEKRVELRLVVNAGSILEDENQRGLAHFVEHMAFNGTENFKKQELTSYLESVGVRFGNDVNAYTSFDETVYMLQVPTDTPAVVEKAFDILEDWAHRVSFEDDEIDRERGVIIEEWRSGRGAQARIRDKQFPVIFKNSAYASRLPIGDKHIIETFPHDLLRSFYRDWYRPDLMALIVVGDIDTAAVRNLIAKHFTALPARPSPKPHTLFPVPDHAETYVTIATDPEATTTFVSARWTLPVQAESTVTDYRRSLAEGLFNGMMNNRLEELSRLADPPFVFATSSKGPLVRTKEAYTLSAAVNDSGVERGFRALLMEARRVSLHGFTRSELERQKESLLRGIQQAYEERGKTESALYAGEYVRNFLTGEPFPGIATEYALAGQLIPTVTLAEVNALTAAWITDHNRILAVSGPRKDGLEIPAESALTAVMTSALSADVPPYVDRVSSAPLVSVPPTPGRITATNTIPELRVQEWTLSNGARVILKPTSFKNDEIVFAAFSPGGTSLADDKDYVPASTAASVVAEGGVGGFDVVELQKKLAGKIVGVTPYIGEIQEGLTGTASPQDVRTLFEMIYLLFTAPRKDSAAFVSYRSRLTAMLHNRSARPESAYEDTVQVTMAQHHPRRMPFTEETTNRLDLEQSFSFYRDRFSDAGDFTFIFVGTFEPDSLRGLVETFVGGLPSRQRKESWKDIGLRPPTGESSKTVARGMEPKSQVRVIFSGPFVWSQENRLELTAVASCLRMKLRESLREEKGGTYGVAVSASPIHYPRGEYRFSVSFGCSPDRVEELMTEMSRQIDTVRRIGPDDGTVEKVKETVRRERETSMKQNGFWLSALQQMYANEDDPLDILRYDDRMKDLTRDDLRRAAEQYLGSGNVARFVLYPEKR